MTEKRYYAHKQLLQENKIHDKRCHNFMNIDETVEHMNNQYWKYKQLKKENEQLKSELAEIKRQEQKVIEYMRAYHNGDINELKKELEK